MATAPTKIRSRWRGLEAWGGVLNKYFAEILNREEVPKTFSSKLISMAMAVGISDYWKNSRQSYSADSNQTVNKTIPLFFKKKSSYPKG